MTNSRYASTDAEEKIPVSTETSYYVVDCPNLHVVSGMQFGAEWSCNQDVSGGRVDASLTRQIGY